MTLTRRELAFMVALQRVAMLYPDNVELQGLIPEFEHLMDKPTRQRKPRKLKEDPAQLDLVLKAEQAPKAARKRRR